ncbi:hypothetical protein MP638_002103 [Amoeboaphelidium occidentale]|nr:hypothetical protein MP638_002103 [Amoeboaphelidium occidentale]
MVEFNDIQLSPEEKLFYANVFNSADTTKKGFFTAPESVQLWKRSKLPEQVLSQIWNMVEKDSATGNVRTKGFAQALRLMSAAQNQRPIDLNAMNQPVQVLVKLEGFESSVSLGTSASVLPLHVTGSSNPDMFNIPPADKQRYLDMFNKSQRNLQIDANSARSIFLQSRLPEDFLSQVWKLVDTQQNGFLNQQSFLMAMWLIQLKLQGVMQVLPASIPPSALQPSLLPSSSSVLGTEWVMPVDERAKAEQFFSNLDTTKRGYLNPDEVVNFFKKSELPDQVLSQIWELMDYDKTSNRMVDKERFCIGWFLIQKKRNGAQLPPSLPKSLLPNSLVHSTLVSPAASMFGGPLGLSSSIADVPGLKEAKSAFLEKQKEFNFIHDKNNQLQRDNLQAQNDLAEYTAKKAALENKIKSLTAEQKELEEKLQGSTASKDAEYKSFLELQSTYTSISAQITSLRAKVEIDNRESEMLKQRTSDGKKWINDLTEELQMLESQNAELEKIKLDLENQFKRQQAEYEELQRKIETAKEQAPKLQNDISKLTEQIASKKVDVMELKQRASFGPTPVLSVKKATESEIPVSAVNWDARSITSAKSDSVAASIKPNVVDRKDSVRSFSAGVSPAVLVPLFPDTTPSNKSNLVSPPTNAIFETTFDDAFSSTPSPAKPERTAEKVPIDASSAFSDAFNVPTTAGSISSKKAKDPFSDFEDLGSSSPTKSDIKSADSDFQEKFPTLDNFEKQMESKGIITEAKNAPAPSKTKSPFDDFEEEFKKLSTASPPVVTVAIEKDFTADFFESNPFGENKSGLKPKKSPTMESGLSSPVTVGDDPFATKGNLNQLADGNEPFKFEDFSSAFPDSNSNIAKVGTQLSTFDNDPFATTTSKTENPFGSTNVFQDDPFSTFDKVPAFSEDPFAEKKPTSVTSGKQKAPEASIKEVMDMGFTEAQASDALSRYDFDVPKAVHFLLDPSNGPKSASSHKREGSQGSEEKKKKWWNPLDRRNSKLKSAGSGSGETKVDF